MDKEILVNSFYLELWNNGNFDVIPNILHKRITLRGGSGVHTRGVQEFEEYYAHLKKAYPDLKYQIEEILVEGDKAAVKLRCSGTHKGVVFEIQPTFDKINYEEVVICTFEHNGIADVWMLGEKYTMIMQGNSEARL